MFYDNPLFWVIVASMASMFFTAPRAFSSINNPQTIKAFSIVGVILLLVVVGCLVHSATVHENLYGTYQNGFKPHPVLLLFTYGFVSCALLFAVFKHMDRGRVFLVILLLIFGLFVRQVTLMASETEKGKKEYRFGP